MDAFSDRMSSPGGKRYREAMAEVMAVLKKYDMAGAITIVDKERAMFRYHFPTWSVAYVTSNGVGIRSKREDFPSRDDQRRACELTAHCIMQMRDISISTTLLCNHLGEIMSNEWGMEHKSNADFDPEYDN